MEGTVNTLISAIAAVVTAIIAYNQYAKNKLTDLKVMEYKKEMEARFSRRADDIACIYAELYRLLHDLKVDRVYILQPHPLINNLYVTISMEVRRKGVSTMLNQVRHLPMGEVAHFVGQLAKQPWIAIKDIEKDMLDKKAKAIMSMNGTTTVVIKKLSDSNGKWIGSLFIESTEKYDDIDGLICKCEIEEVANNIQFILPEYKDTIVG